MFTQCPQCNTYFQVTTEHLKIAQGNVRCGQCRNVFSALGNLSERLPDASDGGNVQFNNHHEEHNSSDFLTDEELGEFEDFDTNIYDDEDSIFDAIADEADIFDAELPEDELIKEQPEQASRNNNFKQAIDKINKLNKDYSKKLPPQTKQPAVQPRVQKPVRKSPLVPASDEAKAFQKAAADEIKALQKAAKKTRDVPVKSHNQNIDIDAAFQAIDELEINDESAQFVASVVEEFEATNLTGNAPDSVAKPMIEISPEPAAVPEKKISRWAKKLKPKKPKPAKPEQKAKPEPKPEPKPKAKKAKPKKQNADKPSKKILIKKRKTRAGKQNQQRPLPANVDPSIIPTLPAILQESLQTEMEQHQSSPVSLLGVGASLALMIVFLFQTVYFKHDQLAKVSQFRPWVESFCRHMDCKVALQFNKKRLELLGQDIRSHPKVKGALRVSTTIINNARYVQSFPGLQITFSDINGQKVAMRRFLPSEYLKKKFDINKGMPSDTPVQVELELMDPGSKAINFEFEFFKAT